MKLQFTVHARSAGSEVRSCISAADHLNHGLGQAMVVHSIKGVVLPRMAHERHVHGSPFLKVRQVKDKLVDARVLKTCSRHTQ